MPTAQEALKTAWQTEIAKISDTLLNAQATYVLDRWDAASVKVAALEGDNVSSYSVLGRTVTKRDITSAKATLASLENQLAQLVYGSVRRIDMNMGSDDS